MPVSFFIESKLYSATLLTKENTKKFQKSKPGILLAWFLLILLTQSVHLRDSATAILAVIFHLPLFIALQLHAAICYTVGNEKDQLLKPNTKFHVKLKQHNLDKCTH